ncbi:hypothetical protein GOP47_0019461 [Adiantum capillus-veneris]|uniref:Uncharacterized protein n=1 Tax=Adiantum capillus-veneris TaxID=13818 RepID=A0A9D4Z9M7_ADICA|nr:hypothetical protein GOP47_0019461 [Adiantum capillus-veneris]
MWCTCSAFFQGGKYVGKTTFFRHAQLRSVAGNLVTELGFVNRDGVEVRHFDDNILDMEPSDASLNVEEGFEEGIEVRSASTTGADEDYQQPSCPDHAPLGIAILSKIIQFQTLSDEYQVPISGQDEMLRLLFGDMGGAKIGKDDSNREDPSLSKILVRFEHDWDGFLFDNYRVPACWDQLQSLFQGLGMVQPLRYRVCMGEEGNRHEPELLRPSKEDNYEGCSVEICACITNSRKRKAKRDCLACCERCPSCQKPRKETLAFDYLSIGRQIELMLKSKSLCHGMLSMWRNQDKWLGKPPELQPEFIHDFWDGAKCRIVQHFWDPHATFELPVICTTPGCKKVYTTFPPSSRPPQEI